MKNKVEKGRDWSVVVYPESAPKNWRSVLDDLHIKWVESPLHDKDVDENGELKKAHWHVLMSFDGPVTFKYVEKIAHKLNTPIPQKVGSARGLVRYMLHLDNPDKHQYSIDDLVAHGGADIAKYFELSKTSKIVLMRDIVEYIYNNKIDNYADFLMICINHSDDWFDIAINYNTLAINKMIDAMWQKNRAKEKVIK